MAHITPIVYEQLARMLADRIAGLGFFNGRIEYQGEQAAYVLTATLVVHRNESRASDVVPVWWEFTMQDDSGVHPTDFSWNEFREYLTEQP